MLIKDIAIFNPKGLKAKDHINYIDTSSVEDGKLIDIQKLRSNFPSRAQRVIQEKHVFQKVVVELIKKSTNLQNNLNKCVHK
jgi:hypothetical protein